MECRAQRECKDYFVGKKKIKTILCPIINHLTSQYHQDAGLWTCSTPILDAEGSMGFSLGAERPLHTHTHTHTHTHRAPPTHTHTHTHTHRAPPTHTHTHTHTPPPPQIWEVHTNDSWNSWSKISKSGCNNRIVKFLVATDRLNILGHPEA